jgi:predicted O-methyltransferase YrrM
MEYDRFLEPGVKPYIHGLSRHDDPVLAEMEEAARQRNFPIIGPVVGRFLFQVALLRGARRIFELGSGFGYSTLWFAKALRRLGGGEVFHTDMDPANTGQARGYLSRAGVSDLVRFLTGEAVASLRSTPGPFDLVYLDLDKQLYPQALAAAREKLGRGGVLLADNTLWFGRVLDSADRAPSTEGIRRFTQELWADRDFFSTLVPLRDGFTISVRL